MRAAKTKVKKYKAKNNTFQTGTRTAVGLFWHVAARRRYQWDGSMQKESIICMLRWVVAAGRRSSADQCDSGARGSQVYQPFCHELLVPARSDGITNVSDFTRGNRTKRLTERGRNNGEMLGLAMNFNMQFVPLMLLCAENTRKREEEWRELKKKGPV